MRHPNKEDYGDGRSVFSEAHADVAVEERSPVIGGREQNGHDEGSNGADDGVEKGGKGNGVVVTLQFLHCFMEVDDGVEKGEYVGAKGGYVLHCPVVGVKDGEEVVHPCCVDQGPRH